MEAKELQAVHCKISTLPLIKQIEFASDLLSTVQGEVESSLEEIEEGSVRYEAHEQAASELEAALCAAQDALNLVGAEN